MNDYERLKEFWNETLSHEEESNVNEKWIEDEKFNSIMKKYYNKDSNILDYGCGSGWAIYEARITNEFHSGVGIDTSSAGINLCKKVAEKNNINNLTFINSDESALKDYVEYFDFAMTFNVLDVLEDNIIHQILTNIKKSLKKGAYIFIGLNPDFTEDELINMIKMEKVGNHYYKNGILRANKKSIEEWKNLFSKYFTLLEQFTFALVEREKQYPRIGFLLTKQ